MKKILPDHIIRIYLLFCCILFFSCASAQSCNDAASIITLTNSKRFFLQDQITTRSGSRVFCGMINQGSDSLAFILSHNERGDVQWAKSYKNDILPRNFFEKITELRDGNFIVTGRAMDVTGHIENLLIVKFDALGNFLWHRLCGPGTFTDTDIQTVSMQVAEDDLGALYFSFYSSSHNFSAVARLGASGNILWSKSFRNGNLISKDSAIFFKPTIVKSDTLYLVGMGWRDQFAMKLNRNTGELHSVKRFSIRTSMPAASLDQYYAYRIFQSPNGHIISATRIYFGLPHSYLFVEWDDQLRFVKAFALDMTNPYLLKLGVTFSFSAMPDGTIMTATPFANDLPDTVIRKIYIAAFDSQLQQVFQKKVLLRRNDYISNRDRDNCLLGTDQRGRLILTPVFSESGQTAIDIYKYNPNSFQQDCIRDEDTVFTGISQLSMQEQSFSFEEIATDVLNEVSATAIVSNEAFTKSVVCEKTSVCDSLSIKGPDQICVENGPAIFTASKNERCIRKVHWDFDSAAVDSVRQVNDTTIYLFFSREWQGQIRTFLEGCSLADTINLIVNKTVAAQLAAENNISLCIGQNNTLSPGKNFHSYLWQDGSIDEKIIIESPGIYWVSVTDIHGCQSADTVTVTALHNRPRDFIATDTVVCLYGNITLQPQGDFISWNWSTGATTPSIKVIDQGIYSITVTDRNNCIGTEHVKVTAIPCANHIFFPNAFSPNGDGKNDLFKPAISGNLVNYRLRVYNRWGQKIFDSIDPALGWNGSTGSMMHASGAYVWQAVVQFAGESSRLLKGTIILFR